MKYEGDQIKEDGTDEAVSSTEEIGNAYKILLSKSESLKPPGRHTHKWKDNIKIALKPCTP
jgi:hypothetical protein